MSAQGRTSPGTGAAISKDDLVPVPDGMLTAGVEIPTWQLLREMASEKKF